MKIIQDFIVRIFKGNSYFATFFISMIPLIELKGAIPFGMSEDIFGGARLDGFSAWISASTGALMPALFLVLLFRPFINLLKRTKTFNKLSQKFEEKIRSKARSIEGKKSIKKYLGLIMFVGLPLPLTGAYTGSLIAAILGLSYFASVLCIFIGNLIAGAIMVLICTIFKGYENIIIYGLLAIILIVLIFKIVVSLIRKNRKVKTNM